MDPPEDVQLSLIVVHSMSVSDRWHFALVFESTELKLDETKAPEIIEPITFVFTSKNIQISVIGR